VADGFSCREQIAQTTGRQALHLADVLALALAGEQLGERPELARMPDLAAASRSAARRGIAAIAVAAAALACAVLLRLRRR
jgi:hypothetical protein